MFQRVTGGDNGLKGVKRGYKGLQGVTRGKKGVTTVKIRNKSKKGNKG